MSPFFDWAYHQSFSSWCWFSFIGNFAAAGGSILGCWLIARVFHERRIFAKPQPLTTKDILLSINAVILNSLVAVAGWLLWKQGWIEIRNTSLARTIVDTAMFIFVMDLAMYVFHRVAHHPLLFPPIHASHHVHVSTNPLSLFVLNPFEVMGFGSLLIAVLVFIPMSGAAVLTYLSFNLLFGTIGHLGVEPLPQGLLRLAPFRFLGTSTFHALHHADRTYNFGFYTTIWDRLFHTLHPGYDTACFSGSVAR